MSDLLRSATALSAAWLGPSRLRVRPSSRWGPVGDPAPVGDAEAGGRPGLASLPSCVWESSYPPPLSSLCSEKGLSPPLERRVEAPRYYGGRGRGAGGTLSKGIFYRFPVCKSMPNSEEGWGWATGETQEIWVLREIRTAGGGRGRRRTRARSPPVKTLRNLRLPVLETRGPRRTGRGEVQ